MGKMIDTVAFGALAATGLYLFFLNAWGSIPLAAGLAFLCTALARGLILARPIKKKASAAQLRGELLRLAGLSDAEAQAELAAWVRTRWPGEAFALAPVLKHPEATLSSGDILNAWKANREAARLVVCATCPAEPRALAYARELSSPPVAVVDSRGLSRLMRRTLPRQAPDPAVPLKTRLRRVAARIAASRVTPRNLLMAAALLALYLRGASPLCLAGALAILAHFGVAIGQRRVGSRLFDGQGEPDRPVEALEHPSR